MTRTIMIDRPRHLQLTDYAMTRLADHYGKPLPEAVEAARCEPQARMFATYVWLLCVTEDPALTVEKMGKIVNFYLGENLIRRHKRLAELARIIIEHCKDIQREA